MVLVPLSALMTLTLTKLSRWHCGDFQGECVLTGIFTIFSENSLADKISLAQIFSHENQIKGVANTNANSLFFI